MDFSVVSQDDGRIAHIKVKGSISRQELVGNRDLLVELLGAEIYTRKLLLDMRDADFVDSSGVGWLLSEHNRFREQGGRLVMYAAPPMVLNVLKVLRMQLVLELAETYDQAMQCVQEDLA